MDSIINVLSNKLLVDITVLGYSYVERDIRPNSKHPEVSYFQPNLQNLYLNFDDCYIRCSSIEQSALLKMLVIDDLAYDFVKGDNDVYSSSSLLDYFLPYGESGVKVTGIRCNLDQQCDLRQALVKSTELILSPHLSIFLDPTYIFGIAIGNDTRRKAWEAEQLRLGETYEVFEWTSLQPELVVTNL